MGIDSNKVILEKYFDILLMPNFATFLYIKFPILFTFQKYLL